LRAAVEDDVGQRPPGDRRDGPEKLDERAGRHAQHRDIADSQADGNGDRGGNTDTDDPGQDRCDQIPQEFLVDE
jgi:hypothetical protein